jgi:hypothetical protein
LLHKLLTRLWMRDFRIAIFRAPSGRLVVKPFAFWCDQELENIAEILLDELDKRESERDAELAVKKLLERARTN